MENTPHINQIIHELLRDNKAFVCYKKPQNKQIKVIIQTDVKLYFTHYFDEDGFVMAPFDLKNNVVFFPNKKSESFTILLTENQKKKQNKTNFINVSGKNKYLSLVQNTIDYIQKGFADKVVISRYLEQSYKENNIGNIYENLLENYPNAMVYIWHHPKVGLWMGATPEKLVELRGTHFSTMALAGTQLYSEKINWQPKEQEEQEWVSKYIIKQLQPISIHLTSTKPYTSKAGHLAHIRTDIDGNLSLNQGLSDLINALHPTPAVCGTPRQTAKNFIIKNEGYRREFYTGFLGEITKNNTTHLYVNLRCMQLFNDIVRIYIGGGITKDSIAENEWKETLNKSKILGRFL